LREVCVADSPAICLGRMHSVILLSCQ
jgi:hypothetical protein